MASIPSNSFQIASIRPREKMRYMAGDTRDHIERAFGTQMIYPYGEVYPGWFEENARRAGTNLWYSTGDAARSFYWQIRYTEGKDDFPAEVSIEYFFNYYLSFVDYGVGKGRPLSKVQRSEPARRKNRYVDEWSPKQGKTHRPVFRKEMRALSRRGAMWLTALSGRLFLGYVFKGLDEITTGKDDTLQHGGFTFENLKVQSL